MHDSGDRDGSRDAVDQERGNDPYGDGTRAPGSGEPGDPPKHLQGAMQMDLKIPHPYRSAATSPTVRKSSG